MLCWAPSVRETRNLDSSDIPFYSTGRVVNVRPRFAIDLILDGVRWQYGFEIDDQRVLGEYAYHYPKGRQALVFRRERDEPEPNFGPAVRSSGRMLARLVRKNALLLSVAGAVGDGPRDERPGISGLIGPLFNWFRANLLLMESDNRMGRIAVTADGLQHPKVREGVLSLPASCRPGYHGGRTSQDGSGIC